jgi:predicted acyl esterase
MIRYLLAAMVLATPALAQVAGEISETPPAFHVKSGSFDYERRDIMIPMRDGIKLHTVILIPRHAKNAPILLTRTPYNATELTTYNHSGHLISALDGYDNADDIIVASGYIRVVQDVRGRRLLHESPTDRPAQHDQDRRIDRHLRHHRLAG